MTADLKTSAPKTEEVSPGVFAYIQPDGTWGINNSGFIVGTDTAAVIDSCSTEQRTRLLQRSLRETSSLPVSSLLNTHHHRDHTFGNYLFHPATIVGHRQCRAEVLRQGLGPKEVIPADDYGDIELAPPNLVFDDTITVFVGDIRIEAYHLGPAHTTNDVVYWLPDRGVLFAGDLIFNGGTPYGAEGSLLGWVPALERLREFDAEVIVPGHGGLCNVDAIDDHLEYLRYVADIAGRALEDGLTPSEATRSMDLSRFAGWSCPERHVANVHCAMQELDPEGPDSVPLEVLLEEMQTDAGRRLTSLA